MIFDAIMNRDPLAPVRLNPNLPPKLEDIINRALEKDRELRYQHAVDIKSELRRLKRDLESGHNSAASSSSEPVYSGSATPGEVATGIGPPDKRIRPGGRRRPRRRRGHNSDPPRNPSRHGESSSFLLL